ncbi:unnamed protein product, partial [Allacma fusca]
MNFAVDSEGKLLKNMLKERLFECFELEETKNLSRECLRMKSEENGHRATFQELNSSASEEYSACFAVPEDVSDDDVANKNLFAVDSEGKLCFVRFNIDHYSVLENDDEIDARFANVTGEFCPTWPRMKSMRKEKLWDCLELESVKAVLHECVTKRLEETENLGTFQDYFHVFGCVAPGIKVGICSLPTHNQESEAEPGDASSSSEEPSRCFDLVQTSPNEAIRNINFAVDSEGKVCIVRFDSRRFRDRCNEDDKTEAMDLKALNQDIVFAELLCDPIRNNNFINLVKDTLKERLWGCLDLEETESLFKECIDKKLLEKGYQLRFQDQTRFFHCAKPGLRKCANGDAARE